MRVLVALFLWFLKLFHGYWCCRWFAWPLIQCACLGPQGWALTEVIPEIKCFGCYSSKIIEEKACVVILCFVLNPFLTHPAYGHFLHRYHIRYRISMWKNIPKMWNGSTYQRKDPQKWALHSLLTQRCGRKRMYWRNQNNRKEDETYNNT